MLLMTAWQEHEAGHSPPSSAKVKNAWSNTSTLPMCLHGMVLGSRTGTTLPLPLPSVYVVNDSLARNPYGMLT